MYESIKYTTQYSKIKALGSGALSGKMLLARIIAINAHFNSG